MMDLIGVNALWKCILPLMASLVVSSAQSQCVRNNFCHLPGKSGISSISSMVARPQPLSCTGLCSQSDSCFVVTFDSSSDICELHSDPDGAECFIVRDDPKKSLWLRKPKGNSCPKVCVVVINIISVGWHGPLFPNRLDKLTLNSRALKSNYIRTSMPLVACKLC